MAAILEREAGPLLEVFAIKGATAAITATSRASPTQLAAPLRPPSETLARACWGEARVGCMDRLLHL
ncbi:hypothetical protein C6Y62_10800 [Hyphomicrobium sulfonivorans]|nr:hypothetical protein [Hyphomicrobium sulfonivorans]